MFGFILKFDQTGSHVVHVCMYPNFLDTHFRWTGRLLGPVDNRRRRLLAVSESKSLGFDAFLGLQTRVEAGEKAGLNAFDDNSVHTQWEV